MEVNLNRILDIGIALTAEKDYNHLLEIILDEAMKITSADGGTLYIYKDNSLYFKIIRNQTLDRFQGGHGESIDLPPVPMSEENVCAYSAIHRKIVNIVDVNHCDEFDFSGPKRYDAITGYKTQSMLVVPLVDRENQLMGVLQLLNALDQNKTVISFELEVERIIHSLSCQTAIIMSNLRYLQEIKQIMNSIVSVLTTAIDERTPYNTNHTKNVTQYAGILIDYVNRQYDLGNLDVCFDITRKEQLLMASMLHDVGKITTPLSIMNKKRRLGNNGLALLIKHFDLIEAYIKIDYLEDRLSLDVYVEKRMHLKQCKELVSLVDEVEYLTDDLLNQINELSNESYIRPDGSHIYFLTEQELECLSIRNGTLTAAERKIMENHAVVTKKLMEKIHFTQSFQNVGTLAAGHHEYLNGTGYPLGLTAEQIPLDMRILVVMDIFDALTSNRPYKKAFSKEKAFHILYQMADVEGKLDRNVIEWLEQALQEYRETDLPYRMLS